MHNLTGPDDARTFVDYWAAQGATSYKAYMNITRAELKAAVDAAHAHRSNYRPSLRRHLPRSRRTGIDDLEHGFFVNTQNDPGKQPDICPRTAGTQPSPRSIPTGRRRRAHQAARRPPRRHHQHATRLREQHSHPLHLQNRVLEAMSPPTREAYLYTRNMELTRPENPTRALIYEHGAKLEHKFVAAGGLLIAGPDPTGDGGILPGFGDHAKSNSSSTPAASPRWKPSRSAPSTAQPTWANNHHRQHRAGKNADLVVINGNPAADINDIEKVEIVFKDGIGYDSAKLFDSIKGRYGPY